MWVELFDAVLSDIPHQETGLYLCENQAWECALVRAWRRNGHGRIIGVPHSTTPFWYLNLYDDPREFNRLRDGAKPIPDALAVNGPMARKALLDAGYPATRLVEVEALRFQYLAPFATRRTNDCVSRTSRLRRRVLVLGDYTFRQTIKMMHCIEAASSLTELEISVTLKPHPTSSIVERDLPSIQFAVTGRPLGEIVGDFDFAFCSNSTSAVLDALLAGLDVAVFLDNEEFNHSPLRRAAGVRFVSSPAELAAALQDGDRGAAPPRVEEFFWIDNRLPRWNRLLSHGTS
jgi:surface carbohydrate biosynthesis protein (TIGR04326 family)